MKEFLYFDKEPTSSTHFNRSLMFGESVFETFRYKQKLPVFFTDHMRRLESSCNFMGIKFPGDFYIESLVEKFVKNHESEHINNIIKDLIVKVLVFSSGGSSYGDLSEKSLVCISIKEDDVKSNHEYSLCLSKNIKASFNPLNSYKTSNYFMSVYEKRIATNRGYDDALFINEKNLVVETTAGNFFWIKGKNVFTPSLKNGPLPGIARSIAIRACKSNKIKVYEGDYEPGSIIYPEAMFITNAVRGIIEVTNLNNTTKPTRTNKLFPKIKQTFYSLLEWS